MICSRFWRHDSLVCGDGSLFGFASGAVAGEFAAGFDSAFGVLDRVGVPDQLNQPLMQCLQLVAPLQALRGRAVTQCWVSVSLASILKTLLVRNGLLPQLDFKLELHEAHLVPLMQQVEETDWDFFHRLLATYGLIYCYRQLPQHVLLVISERMPPLNERTWTLSHEQAQLQVSYQLASDALTLIEPASGFSDHPLEVKTRNQSSLQGVGQRHEIASPVHAHAGLKKFAQVKQAQLNQTRSKIRLKTSAVLPDINDALSFPEFFNNPLRVCHLTLLADYSAYDTRQRSALQVSLHLAPPDQTRLINPNFFPKPRLHFTQGTIVQQSQKPDHYWVRLQHLDHPDSAHVELPFLQVNRSQDSGARFPLLPHNEVLILYLEGDCDRPVIYGLSAPQSGQDNVLRFESALGHVLALRDHPAQCTLSTPDQMQHLCLDDKANALSLTCGTPLEMQALGALKFRGAESITYTVGGDYTLELTGQACLKAQVLHVQCGEAYLIETADRLVLESLQGSLSLVSDAHFHLNAEDGLSLTSDKNLEITAEQGLCELTCHGKLHLQAGQTLVFRQGHASITLTHSGHLRFKAARIRIETSEFFGQGQPCQFT